MNTCTLLDNPSKIVENPEALNGNALSTLSSTVKPYKCPQQAVEVAIKPGINSKAL